MIERIDQEGRVGPSRPDRAVLQHLGQQFARFLAIFGTRDDLGDHRVVEGRDFGALIDASIHASAMLGTLEEFQSDDRGHNAIVRFFGLNPSFTGSANWREVTFWYST